MMKKCILRANNSNCSFADNAGLTLLRVFVGLSMALAHGLGKLPPPQPVIDGVSALGFPMPHFFAWCAALAEFVGGLLLAAGFLTRPAAAMMASTMLVAAFGAHATDPYRIKELAFLFLVISIFFVLRGAGNWSLDRLFFKKS